MRVSRILLIAFSSLGLAATAAEAVAQPQQEPISTRPFRGVFGGGQDNATHSLTVTGSLGVSYDSDIYAAFRGDTLAGESVLRPRSSGTATFGSGTAAYALRRERVDLGVSGSGTVYAYREDGTQFLRSYNVSGTQGLAITRRTRLTASQTVSVQPFAVGRLFPTLDTSFGAPVVPSYDDFISDDAYTWYSASVDINQQITGRVSAYGGYALQSAELSLNQQHRVDSGRGGIAIGLSRDLGVRMGYSYSQGRLGGRDSLIRSHAIDAGLDFSRALSLSRRTTLSFSTGSTAIRDRQRTHFRLTGRAQLDRAIARTWRTGIGYTRDVHYMEQLGDVVFSDGVHAFVGGLLNRRQSLQATVGVSVGDVGFQASDNGASTTFASVGLVNSLSRVAALTVDYRYYVHSFGSSVALPTGVLRDLDRHSVRAYVTLWAPVFSDARSANAAR
jgi:hypothetical protein